MFRTVLICLWSMLFIIACGPTESPEKKPKIKLDKKVAISPVDGSQFLVATFPRDMKRIDANLDNRIMLAGYSIDFDTFAPGQSLNVTWFWKCLKPVDGEWEYFTHLMDEDGDMIASVNSHGAMRARYKPQMWKPGEIIKDAERIQIPTDWKSNILELRTGLWQGPNRMRVVKGPVDEEGRVRGPVVTISADAPKPIARSSASVTIPYISRAPDIDGKLNEEVWQSAVGLSSFVNTLNGRPVRRKTDVRLLWDDTHLYVAMVADDTELINPETESSQDIWKADALDVFLTPDTAGPYYEIQISPSGIIYDAEYTAYREANASWESGITVATDVAGTVNDTAEPADQRWTVEAAIPLTRIATGAMDNRTFQGNFFRIDRTAGITEYSGWSAPMRGDFHAQDRFGRLVFKK
jgi:hypothetical protein